MYWTKLKNARNPYTNFVTLRELSKSRSKKIRAAVAANRNLQTHVIDELVHDASPIVRKALIENPNLTLNAYNKLLEDNDMEIRNHLEESWTEPPAAKSHRS